MSPVRPPWEAGAAVGPHVVVLEGRGLDERGVVPGHGQFAAGVDEAKENVTNSQSAGLPEKPDERDRGDAGIVRIR